MLFYNVAITGKKAYGEIGIIGLDIGLNSKFKNYDEKSFFHLFQEKKIDYSLMIEVMNKFFQNGKKPHPKNDVLSEIIQDSKLSPDLVQDNASKFDSEDIYKAVRVCEELALLYFDRQISVNGPRKEEYEAKCIDKEKLNMSDFEMGDMLMERKQELEELLDEP